LGKSLPPIAHCESHSPIARVNSNPLVLPDRGLLDRRDGSFVNQGVVVSGLVHRMRIRRSDAVGWRSCDGGDGGGDRGDGDVDEVVMLEEVYHGIIMSLLTSGGIGVAAMEEVVGDVDAGIDVAKPWTEKVVVEEELD
jgi:hypothetical protein